MENVELLHTFGGLPMFFAAGSALFMLLRSKTRIPYKRILLGLVLMLPALGRAQTNGAPPGYTPCTLDANGNCGFSGPVELAYACVGPSTAPCPSGTFIFRRFQGPSIACNGRSFGLAASLQGPAYNKCYIPTNPPVALPADANSCAPEGAVCYLGNVDTVNVFFGANGSFVSRVLNTDPSSTQTKLTCIKDNFFFVDPAFGVPKNCYTSKLFILAPYGYTKCADEHAWCSFTGPASVAFGINGNFVFNNSASDGILCESSSFNNADPAQNTIKSCYIPADPPGYAQCASENSVCSFNGPATVAFGAAGHFTFKTLSGGTSCSDTVFGDPAYGIAKSCYLPSGPNGFQFCSSEDNTCHVPPTGSSSALVYFGFNGAFRSTIVAPTGVDVPCYPQVFGDPTPAPGTVRACFIIGQYFQ